MANPMDDAEAKLQRALQDQFEALGVGRRQRLSEDDYKENLRAVPRASALEAQRRVNQRGTDESRVSNEVRQRLTHWGTAWTELSNDDATTESLQDINSGQTHRANLALRVAQPSELHYDERGDFSGLRYRAFNADRGGRARGGGRGGRGGGQIGSRGGRHGPIRLPKGLPPIEEPVSPPKVKDKSALRGGRTRTLPTTIHLNGEPTTHARLNAIAPRDPVAASSTVRKDTRSALGNFETSLADPETFMAMARRNRPNGKVTDLKTSETPSSVNNDQAMPPREALLDLNSETISPPTPRPASPLPQADNQLESSHADDSLDLHTEIANDEDVKKIQQLKEIAARMGGMYLEEILPVIEKLQRRIDSRASQGLRTQNTEEGRMSAGTLQTESAAPWGFALEAPIEPSATTRNEGAIETSPQPTLTRIQVDNSTRHDSMSSVRTSVSSAIAGRSMLNMPDRGDIHRRNESAASVSMGIKDVKNQVVKVGAIIGEHIHKDHWQPRLRSDSMASSVTSTVDEVRSISANFSRLSLRERSTSRPATSSTTRPSENVLPSAPLHTMRDTSRLPDNAITRQYSMQTPSSEQTVYASTNPFSQRPAPIERSRASSEAISIEQQGSTTQRDPFAVRFNTAPYRQDQTSARITPSNVPKPKIPNFLKDLTSDAARDVGAAARRQYGGPPMTSPQPRVLAEVSTNHGGLSSSATVSAIGNMDNPTTTMPPKSETRSTGGSVTSENERTRLKKDPWNTARRRME